MIKDRTRTSARPRLSLARRQGVLTPAFLLSSLLGIVWLVAHNALKLLFFHESSVGWPLALVWAAAYVIVFGGNCRWMVAPIVALGVISCYWLAVMHVGIEVPDDLFLWPLLSAYPRLLSNIVYGALLTGGIVVGLVNIWTAVPVLRRTSGVSPRRFGLVMGAILLVAGAVAIEVDRSPAGHAPERWARIVAFAVIPALIMSVPRRAT